MQFRNHDGVSREETERFLGSPFQRLKLNVNQTLSDAGGMCCNRKTHQMHLAFLPAHQREHVLILRPCFEKDQINEEVPDNFNMDAEYVKRPASCGDEDDGLLGKGMRLAG